MEDIITLSLYSKITKDSSGIEERYEGVLEHLRCVLGL